MADAIESARKVFDLFQDTYEAFANRPNQLWAVEVYDEGVGAGLSDSEIGAGTRVLAQKGLIRARTRRCQKFRVRDGISLTPAAFQENRSRVD